VKQKGRIEIFSAGCQTCKTSIETVRRLAADTHHVEVLDMHNKDVAARAEQYGVKSVPAVVIDGKLAGCCAGRGVDTAALRAAGVGVARK
jgi:glutaredoxin 3